MSRLWSLPPVKVPDPFPTSDEVIAEWEQRRRVIEPGFIVEHDANLVERVLFSEVQIVGVFRIGEL